jgi:hypothetical protein
MTDPVRPVAPREDEWELRARQMLWLGHGCGIAPLYGDDGELQCNNTARHRPLDFKREDWDVLQAEILRLNLAAAPVPCAASPADPEPGLAFIRSEATRTAGKGRLGELWAAVLVEAERLHVERALGRAVTATKSLREKELQAEQIPTGFMEMRLRATGEGARDAVAGLPTVPVPPVAPVEE